MRHADSTVEVFETTIADAELLEAVFTDAVRTGQSTARTAESGAPRPEGSQPPVP